MIRALNTEDDLAEAVAALVAIEPRFAVVTARHGLPPLRRAPQGFAALLQIVTEQMISLKAAKAIWNRIEAAIAPLQPATVLRRSEAALMALGLSGAKARSFRAIAKAMDDGSCAIEKFAAMDDGGVFESLVAIPGIGPWTADIYLLACLGRSDVWPAGDIALQAAAQDLLGLAARPDAKALRALAENWRPFRAVAARLLWSHYRHLKGLSQSVT